MLKKILMVLSVLFGLFVLMGIIFPSVEYGHQISSSKPLEECWHITQDTTKMHRWLQGFKSISLEEGEAGKKGSHYRVVVNPGEGQEDFVMQETIVGVQPYDSIAMVFDSEMMVFEQTMFTRTDKKGNTIIGTRSRVKGKNFMLRSMFAMMHYFANSFEQQEIKNIEALKEVIDNNTDLY